MPKDETYKLAMGIIVFIYPSMLKVKVPYLLERYRGASSVAAFLLLFSLALLLFGALSLPIFKPVYIFALETSSIVQGKTPATELRFGVWGLCAANVVGNKSVKLIGCTSPQLGYHIRDDITALIGMTADTTTGLRAVITVSLLNLLVLHPIAAGLVFLSLFLTLFLASTLASVFAVLFATLGALAATIAFAVDLAMITFARQQLQLTVSQFSVASGSAVWTVLAAACMTWAACLVLFIQISHCCAFTKYVVRTLWLLVSLGDLGSEFETSTVARSVKKGFIRKIYVDV